MTKREKTCHQRLQDRMSDIRTLWGLYRQSPEEYDKNLGHIEEYVADEIPYVPIGTFETQTEAFYRWRFYESNQSIEEFHWIVDAEFKVYRIEYWCANYYESERIILPGEDAALLCRIWIEYFGSDVSEALLPAGPE